MDRDEAKKNNTVGLVRQLGLFDSTMIMVGIVIGSGIFLKLQGLFNRHEITHIQHPGQIRVIDSGFSDYFDEMFRVNNLLYTCHDIHFVSLATFR